MTSKMIFKVTKLQFHTIIYPRENKYKSRHTVYEESSEYNVRQQGYQNT